MLKEDLQGGWSLVSIKVTDTSGAAFPMMGTEPRGHVVYSHDGYVAVTLSEPGRQPLGNGTRWALLGDAEAAQLARTFMAYSGRYVTDDDAQTVTHNLEVCLDPTLTLAPQVRHVRFTPDGELELQVPMEELDGQAVSRVALLWRRDPV